MAKRYLSSYRLVTLLTFGPGNCLQQVEHVGFSKVLMSIFDFTAGCSSNGIVLCLALSLFSRSTWDSTANLSLLYLLFIISMCTPSSWVFLVNLSLWIALIPSSLASHSSCDSIANLSLWLAFNPFKSRSCWDSLANLSLIYSHPLEPGIPFILWFSPTWLPAVRQIHLKIFHPA